MPTELTSLDDEGAAMMLRSLLTELADARVMADDAARRVDGIRKVVDGLVEMYPALWDLLPDDLDGSEKIHPRGSEAVRRILMRNIDKWYAVSGVVAMLEREGWGPPSANPANAVRTALERLVDRKVVEKGRSTEGAVIYRFPAQKPPTAPGGYDQDEEPF